MTLVSTVGGASGPALRHVLPADGRQRRRGRIPRRSRVRGGAAGRARRASSPGARPRPGDKTMYDALAPACDALDDALADGAPLADALAAARAGRRRRAGRDDPDARPQGPGVVPRRAQRRPPGPRRDVGRPAGRDRRAGAGLRAVMTGIVVVSHSRALARRGGGPGERDGARDPGAHRGRGRARRDDLRHRRRRDRRRDRRGGRRCGGRRPDGPGQRRAVRRDGAGPGGRRPPATRAPLPGPARRGAGRRRGGGRRRGRSGGGRGRGGRLARGEAEPRPRVHATGTGTTCRSGPRRGWRRRDDVAHGGVRRVEPARSARASRRAAGPGGPAVRRPHPAPQPDDRCGAGAGDDPVEGRDARGAARPPGRGGRLGQPGPRGARPRAGPRGTRVRRAAVRRRAAATAGAGIDAGPASCPCLLHPGSRWGRPCSCARPTWRYPPRTRPTPRRSGDGCARRWPSCDGRSSGCARRRPGRSARPRPGSSTHT